MNLNSPKKSTVSCKLYNAVKSEKTCVLACEDEVGGAGVADSSESTPRAGACSEGFQRSAAGLSQP